MKRSVIKAILAAALFACSFAALSAEPAAQIKIACVGDSITYGSGIADRNRDSYPAQLAALLGPKWAVANFGVSGATLLKQGDRPYHQQTAYADAHTFAPNVVIIKLGTNDSKPDNWKHKADFVADYIALIESFQSLASKPTVWIAYPVPAFPGRWEISDTVIKDDVIPLIDEVARRTKVKVIDLYAALRNQSALFPDTVHPNAAGAKIIAESIAPILLRQ